MASYLDEKYLLSLADIDPELKAVRVALQSSHHDLMKHTVLGESQSSTSQL